MKTQIQNAAFDCLRKGISAIPTGPDKRPLLRSWKQYQENPMLLDEVERFFTHESRLAAVCGKVSGNLECLDFDDPSTLQPFLDLIDQQVEDLRKELFQVQTPSGGYHIIYRCESAIPGNQKLAIGLDGQVRIETRGEGGYFLTCPSPGYTAIQGALIDCPTITFAQREILIASARAFNLQVVKTEQKEPGDSTGESFDHGLDITTLLLKYGWKEAGRTTAGMGWTRPGKEDGVSGVLLETGNFYAWTSNATHLEPNKSYSPWGLFTAYEAGGDFSLSARMLIDQGIATAGEKKEPDETVIKRLAALPLLEFDRALKAEAKKLGVRPAILDKIVQAARKEQETKCSIFFDMIDPWEDSINPSELFNEIRNTVERHIVCSKEASIAATLWTVMTWVIDVVQVAPIAVITAPEKGCGKSMLLFLLGLLTPKTLTASGISPAALFRTIEKYMPTLCIDEVDTFMKENEEMRGLINSGHTRGGAFIIRLVGDNHEPKKFSTFCAKALAGIGKLPDTIMDRAIVLEMRRKLQSETVERLRNADPELFETLKSKLARFADDHREEIRNARPVLPSELNDRQQDNWESLIAIADIAGGEWPEIARAAALKLSGESDTTLTVGLELLRDIKAIFDEKKEDKIGTSSLIDALCLDEELRWANFDKGFPIKPVRVAKYLSQYGIKSSTIRLGKDTVKGYKLSSFKDVFERYLANIKPEQEDPKE